MNGGPPATCWSAVFIVASYLALPVAGLDLWDFFSKLLNKNSSFPFTLQLFQATMPTKSLSSRKDNSSSPIFTKLRDASIVFPQ